MTNLLFLSLLGLVMNAIGKGREPIKSIICEGNETTINISQYETSDAHMYLATQTDNKNGEVLETYYGQLFNWLENEPMDEPGAFINGFNGISQSKHENGNRIELKIHIYNEHGKDQTKYISNATFQKVKVTPVTLGITSIGQPEEESFDCVIHD